MKNNQSIELDEIKNKYEQSFTELKNQNDLLKVELSQIQNALKKYQNKDAQINSALIVAVETAKEIENNAAAVYDLEIKRIRLLYKKLNTIIEQIKAVYPIQNTMGLDGLVNEFEIAVSDILQKENKIKYNKESEKVYAKTLLSRMWGNANSVDATQSKTLKTQIARKNTQTDYVNNVVNHELERLNTKKTELEAKKGENVGEFLKFLTSEFDDFDNYQTNTPEEKLNKMPDFAENVELSSSIRVFDFTLRSSSQ